jgi:hypothetical protein
MHASQVQSILHASLSNPKWILICMSGWRVIFCPAMHLSMQNAYACPYAWCVGLTLRTLHWIVSYLCSPISYVFLDANGSVPICQVYDQIYVVMYFDHGYLLSFGDWCCWQLKIGVFPDLLDELTFC